MSERSEPLRGLAKIIKKICDERGEAYPWDKPPLHVDLPALRDDAGPVETMLAEAAGHRQFMASIAPPPDTDGDGSRVMRRRSLREMTEEALAAQLRKPQIKRDFGRDYDC